MAKSVHESARGLKATRAVTTLGVAGVGLAGILGGALLVATGSPATAAATCAATSPSASPSQSGSASPSQSASPSPSPSPSASASPTPTPAPTTNGDGSLLGGITDQLPLGNGQGTESGTPQPSGSASQSPTGAPSSSTTISLSARRVVKGDPVRINGRGLPGCRVQILGYTRPNTTYKIVRAGTIADNGTFAFTVYPPSNTRVYAHSEGAGNNSRSAAVNVRFVVSLKVTRVGNRSYRFEGGVGPGAPGVHVTVYRSSRSGPVPVDSTDTASNGAWSLVHNFSGTGTFTFYAVAATTANNDSNRSPLTKATIR